MAQKTETTVTNIQPIEYLGDTYNLHVEDNHNYFANGINVSNCHHFKANALKGILESLKRAKWRIGTTGTLDGKKVHQMVLEGLFGPIEKIISTKELQDQGKLSKLSVTQFVFSYPDEVRKILAKMNVVETKTGHRKTPAKYPQEIDWIVECQKRNRTLANMALSTSGNTLVLFKLIKHGKALTELLKDRVGDRPLYFIDGGVVTDVREGIRVALKTENNAIVVASYGTMSTGINIPSIENIIFAHPTKSLIRVLQSIGRGLRLNTGKSRCNLFDIVDDFSWKSYQNHTLKHGEERYGIYAREEFPTKVVEISI